MAITKAELKNAFREVASLEFSHIPTDETSIKYNFSDKFNKRMQKLIKSQKKAYWCLVNTAAKRVAIIFLAIFTMFTAAFSVKAIREPVVNFIMEIYETFTHYLFEGDTTNTISKEYSITELPDGYIQTNKFRNENLITTIYEKTAHNVIEFTQTTTKHAQIHIDNEHESVYKDIVNGIEINISETLDIKHVFWIKDNYYFDITCYGDISIDTIKELIMSIDY